jgi:hypothetical protein
MAVHPGALFPWRSSWCLRLTAAKSKESLTNLPRSLVSSLLPTGLVGAAMDNSMSDKLDGIMADGDEAPRHQYPWRASNFAGNGEGGRAKQRRKAPIHLVLSHLSEPCELHLRGNLRAYGAAPSWPGPGLVRCGCSQSPGEPRYTSG